MIPKSSRRSAFSAFCSVPCFHVQSSGKKEVTGSNVLVAIFSEKQSQAVYFLNLQDITRLDVVNYISHGLPQVPGEEGSEKPDAQVEADAEVELSAARSVCNQPE